MKHSNFRASVKVSSLLILLACLLPGYLISYPFGKRIRRFFSYPFFRYCVKCAGLNLNIVGSFDKKAANFYISNHVSYLDIPVLASMIDGLFIAKSEVAKWPLIGFLAKIGRTHFVSRKAVNTLKEREEIAHRLKKGETILLFPEGSSSDGNNLLPFRPGLLSTALLPINDIQIAIQPVTITYGPDAPQDKREKYAWYGDMEMGPHVWYLLGIKEKINVTLTFHECQCPKQFNDRKIFAAWAEETIRSGLKYTASETQSDYILKPVA